MRKLCKAIFSTVFSISCTFRHFEFATKSVRFFPAKIYNDLSKDSRAAEDYKKLLNEHLS